MNVALIGCGFIADHYARSIRGYPELRLRGVADRDPARARHFADHHRVRAYRDLGEILSDPEVELVLNLTNPASHHAVSKACLDAGRHVYSEKPLATDLGQARELVALAEGRGLRIAAAPSNLLGECGQTLWKAVRQAAVGRVRAVYAEMDDGLLHRMPYERWKSESGTPWPYRDEFGVGCTMEHAGYALSLLVAFFGPARSVTAFSSVQVPDKRPDIPAPEIAPDLSIAAIVLESGVVARLTNSVIAPPDHAMRILGDEGVLYTPNVWRYDAPVYSRRWVRIRRRLLLSPWRRRHPRLRAPGHRPAPDDRARGVAELASAIREGRPSRLSAQLALHVTELTLAIQNAGRAGAAYPMTTRFDPIAPLPWGT